MINEFQSLETAGLVFFAAAVAHTFASSWFRKLGNRFAEGSAAENFFHLLGEVEVVFGIWAGLLFLFAAFRVGGDQAVKLIERCDFTEPLFIFAVMAISATRPVRQAAEWVILFPARGLPNLRAEAEYFSILVLGPLLGSFITEPAAMTITALALGDRFLAADGERATTSDPATRESSRRFRYVTLAVLLVNVSIGGVLTPFSAPPVLMVARAWAWDLQYMLSAFGWRAACAVVINASLATALFRRAIRRHHSDGRNASANRTADGALAPLWLVALHLVCLALTVLYAHHPAIFLGVFMYFLGLAQVTREHQDELRLRESLLVAFFLAGLVVLGSLQSWWLTPLLTGIDRTPLFLGAAFLTSFTDNAALTYLGTLIPSLGPEQKYALVAGAVAGGGLTVIANAPNPAAFAILGDRFGPGGINPLRLLAAALAPTAVAMACLGVG